MSSEKDQKEETSISSIGSSIKKALEDRLKGQFIPAYIISFLLRNWKAFYITFFVSEEYIYKTQESNNKLFFFPDILLNKLEYLLHYYEWYIVRPLIFVALYYFLLPVTEDLISVCRFQRDKFLSSGGIKGIFRNKSYNVVLQIKTQKQNSKNHTYEDEQSILYHLYNIVNYEGCYIRHGRDFSIPLEAIATLIQKDIITLHGDNSERYRLKVKLTIKGEYLVEKRCKEQSHLIETKEETL